MQVPRPAVAVELAGPCAGVGVDLGVEPVEPAVRRRRPHLAGHGLGQGAELRLALRQLPLDAARFRHVLHDPEQPHRTAGRVPLVLALAGDGPLLAGVGTDDPVFDIERRGAFAPAGRVRHHLGVFGDDQPLDHLRADLVGALQAEDAAELRRAVDDVAVQVDGEDADAAGFLRPPQLGGGLQKRLLRPVFRGAVPQHLHEPGRLARLVAQQDHLARGPEPLA